MNGSSVGGDRDMLSHVLLPVASEMDARSTAKALESYRVGRITAIHVVEKGEGVPDKTPVEQSEQIAEASFDAVQKIFPEADTAIRYRRDVVTAIIDVAGEVDATAIAFRPREGTRIHKFLSGDLALKLITRADRPVIALSGEDSK